MKGKYGMYQKISPLYTSIFGSLNGWIIAWEM